MTTKKETAEREYGATTDPGVLRVNAILALTADRGASRAAMHVEDREMYRHVTIATDAATDAPAEQVLAGRATTSGVRRERIGDALSAWLRYREELTVTSAVPDGWTARLGGDRTDVDYNAEMSKETPPGLNFSWNSRESALRLEEMLKRGAAFTGLYATGNGRTLPETDYLDGAVHVLEIDGGRIGVFRTLRRTGTGEPGLGLTAINEERNGQWEGGVLVGAIRARTALPFAVGDEYLDVWWCRVALEPGSDARVESVSGTLAPGRWLVAGTAARLQEGAPRGAGRGRSGGAVPGLAPRAPARSGLPARAAGAAAVDAARHPRRKVEAGERSDAAPEDRTPDARGTEGRDVPGRPAHAGGGGRERGHPAARAGRANDGLRVGRDARDSRGHRRRGAAGERVGIAHRPPGRGVPSGRVTRILVRVRIEDDDGIREEDWTAQRAIGCGLASEPEAAGIVHTAGAASIPAGVIAARIVVSSLEEPERNDEDGTLVHQENERELTESARRLACHGETRRRSWRRRSGTRPRSASGTCARRGARCGSTSMSRATWR